MGIATGIGVYFVVWWITLFMVLPWGNRPEEEVQQGNVPSAPARPRLWLKAGVTTVLAAVFWLIIWYVVQSDWIQLRDPGPL